MTAKHTVVGHFDCGCGHAAQPQSLELVICNSRNEVEAVVERMKQHSAARYQCLQEPAMAIVVVPGEPEIVHEVKQLPEAYLLFRSADSYVKRHDERKRQDAEGGRGTRAELFERLRQEHGSTGPHD